MTDLQTPDSLAGRTVLVTGGNSGVGRESARTMAAAGARVLVASRNLDKAEDALADILDSCPQAAVEVVQLDLADLASVAAAAQDVAGRLEHLDVLVNNAGVMAVPYGTTADGFEMQLGTNHLGHFALTGHLLPQLLAAPAPRVVNVSSNAHKLGSIDFDNLDASQGYSKSRAYAQSKLANLLFTCELQRRAEEAGTRLLAVGAHPGYAATNLFAAGPASSVPKPIAAGYAIGARLIAQDAEAGSWPLVAAAVAPGVEGGDYIGPRGPFEFWGRPKKVTMASAARDPETARRLWEVSEELTGVRYEQLEVRT